MENCEKDYPSTAKEWREYHAKTAMTENEVKPLTLREKLEEVLG